MRAHPFGIALAAGALLALGGCAVYPAPGPYYGYGPADQAIVAPYGPPPLIAETYGPPPVVGDIWIGGFWSWNGGRHVWTPGRWEHPRAGYRWVPRTWQHGGNGWQQRGGRWERR